ncbi:ATP-binding protein [Marinobacter sp. CA1]|uniref:ATP-binding protein n=1 Tax=Marinobacter sp. CA1 TaxID=2817656 RepID=UPI001D08B38E|nr:ATP-binding protein [Marinobacter sp. CA1]UDL07042.1 PAS domain S-box protein [Marinobacter sp. CA1]
MSFRWKTIAGIGLIEVFFLSILVWQAIFFIRETFNDSLEHRARDTLMLASSVVVDDLVTSDIASLNEQIEKIQTLQGVEYVRVSDYEQLVVASGIADSATITPDKGIDSIDDGIYDQRQTIVVGGQQFGWIEIGMSVRELEQTLAQAKLRFYSIAGLELVLVALTSFLFARYLTHKLIKLRDTANQVSNGEDSPPIEVNGTDELSQTVQAFNYMLAKVQKREQSLKDLNAKLIEVNARYQRKDAETTALLQATPDAMVIVNKRDQVVFANQAMELLVNRQDHPIHGKPVVELLGENAAEFRGSLQSDDPQIDGWIDFGFYRSDGFWALTSVRILSFDSYEEGSYLLVIRDRTDAARLEKSARVSERLKSSLIDSSLDALVTIDKHGRVTDFSQSAEIMFGWRKGEMLGEEMAEFIIPPEFRDAHHKGFSHFLNTGEGPLIGQRIETFALKKSGDKFPVELALTAVRIDEEVYVTATIRDIADRKAKEDELLAAKENAEDASRAKSRFLSHMSHEIRSPLTAVLGSLSLLDHRVTLAREDHRFLQMARRSGDSLLQVVNEILDFSRIEAGETEYQKIPFSPLHLVKEAISGIEVHRQKEEVLITSQAARYVPDLVIADRDHLRQVLTILLDNGVKFTEEGTVLVELDSLDDDDSGSWLKIQVRDTGPGIPEELVESVFSEFGQVDAARDRGFGGSGLGLAIAKQLISGMNGTISLKSSLGHGSTFSVTIPYTKATEEDLVNYRDKVNSDESADPALSPLDQWFIEKRKVLLVDDVEANLVIGAEMLRSRGFLVETAKDGREAVAMAANEPFDAILMDLRMPVMNGLEATQHIRQSGGVNAQTPIIAVSANAEKSEMDRCKRTGMNDFVSKPFNLQRLVKTVNHSIDNTLPLPEANQAIDAGEPLLSKVVLKQLSKDTSESSIPLMLSVFMNEVKKRSHLIDIAINDEDYLELREQAHALKSCSGTFGAMRLHVKAKDLELAIVNDQLDEALAMMNSLKTLMDSTIEEYASHLKSLTK